MKNKFKIFIVFAGCFLFRLLPLRAPNVEPIMASIMPLWPACAGRRKFGALTGFLFGFLSIFLYDAVTHFGSWTWIAGITYGIIGAISALYFSKVHPEKGGASILNFVTFAVIATLFYDLVTGVLFAPIFGETLTTAFVLQIPFTVLHLAGNIGFAVTLSPILNKWFLKDSLTRMSFGDLKKPKQVF